MANPYPQRKMAIVIVVSILSDSIRKKDPEKLATKYQGQREKLENM